MPETEVVLILGAVLAATWGFGVLVRALQFTHARNIHAKLTQDKLDLMKTAISMGYQADDLKELDQRLASIGGQEALKDLLPSSDITEGPSAVVTVEKQHRSSQQ